MLAMLGGTRGCRGVRGLLGLAGTRYSGARRGIWASGTLRDVGGVGGHWGHQGYGGVRDVLGAGRDCRDSGARRVWGHQG